MLFCSLILAIILGFILYCLFTLFLYFKKYFCDSDYKNKSYNHVFLICILISLPITFFLCKYADTTEPEKETSKLECSQTSIENTVQSTSKRKSTTYSDYDDAYEKGYDNGYDDGYFDGKSGSDMSVHEILNSEAFTIIREEAELYASSACEWHPLEAYDIIICYLNREKYFDSVPTNEEFIEAVETLLVFYDFFYSN